MFVSSVLDVAQCCKLVNRSYNRKAATERYPVRSYISFSGTLASTCAGTGAKVELLFADALPLSWHLTLFYDVLLTHYALLATGIRAYWIFTNLSLPPCYPAL